MSRHREKLFFLLNPTHSQRDSREIYFFKPSAQNSGLCTHKEKATHMRKYANRVCTCVCVCQDTKREMYYFIEPQSPSKVHERIIFLNPLLKTQVHERFVLKPSTSKLRFVLYSQKATQRGLREMLRRHSVHGRTKTFKVSLNILSERCLQWVSRTERHIFHTRPCV